MNRIYRPALGGWAVKSPFQRRAEWRARIDAFFYFLGA